MNQMKTRRSAPPAAEKSEVMKETILKSRLTASNEFEFRKLVRPQEGFLNCSMEEEKESLTVTYEIQMRYRTCFHGPIYGGKRRN